VPTITLADADGGTELKIRAALIVEVATRKVIASQ